MDKPIIYSEIPAFDQATQYVTQKTPEDMGDYIFVGIEIRTADYVFSDEYEEIIAALEQDIAEGNI